MPSYDIVYKMIITTAKLSNKIVQMQISDCTNHNDKECVYFN